MSNYEVLMRDPVIIVLFQAVGGLLLRWNALFSNSSVWSSFLPAISPLPQSTQI